MQGALKVEYSKYSAFNATQQMGQKTNNIVQVISFAILNINTVLKCCSKISLSGLRNEDKITSSTMHHSFRPSLPDLPDLYLGTKILK